MTASIAIFGSAFNPPSLGHQSVITRLGHFDQVLLLPSFRHAWGKNMLDYDSRCQLVSAFIEDIQQPNVTLSRIEEDIAVGDEAITTFAVLEALEERHPNANLTFVIGPDNFLNFSKFYKADAIMTRWQVLACPETVPVRSTDIRDHIINNRTVSHLTTPKVANMLREKGWYSQ
ncbi:nicotinate-nicotinamide nucleotide adenylyltransferase [Photobacterium aphoticum]|uniref:nicotinate-nucleotide adenylyltransferase n=1 Tax=Photobacterium aphoticum TaxID=754436 RepID=A0A0J1GQB4_9GAMM|nr:nicotinate-nicotinamide nucleotide adenylyltransferase [Photobacterium aphoticum]KLV01973.1 nicotinic acid mononucleotide adenylyltransferase [Photobacterium aphoticum]PSU60217.1 nicotinate-nicotinamide nucleotide adenylyltransferase [Photobacterium aphoticum]GHA34141.1 nicotinate-nicotinamide nucleotide adenylyltransferase [Photobacterium aphoticum]